MKIYSKFKDFYDIGLSHGIDDDIKFIRDIQYIDCPDDLKDVSGFDVYGRRYNQHVSTNIVAKYIFFCGKMIPYIDISHCGYGQPDSVHYNAESFHKFVETFKDGYSNGFNVESYMSNDRRDFSPSWRKDITFSKKGIEDFFKTGKNIDESIFFKYDCPYFIFGHDESLRYTPQVKEYNKKKLIKNPVLKDMEFFKHMDSFTCFQEISMFLGGILGSSPKEIIQVSDEVLRDKRGFDKWSFKKMPTKK